MTASFSWAAFCVYRIATKEVIVICHIVIALSNNDKQVKQAGAGIRSRKHFYNYYMQVMRFDRAALSLLRQASAYVKKILLLLTRVREIYAGLPFTHWERNIYGRSRLECITFRFKNRKSSTFCVCTYMALTNRPVTT